MARETQETVGRWVEETFPGGDPESPRKALRALEECVEMCVAAGAAAIEVREAVSKALAENPHGRRPEKVAQEAADVLIVLYGLAHLRGFDLSDAIDQKMKTNRQRRWRALGDGTGYHVKEGAQTEVPAARATPRPRVVTLCGSTRFADEYTRVTREETLAGRIVISVGLFGHQEGLDMGGPVKAMLDELHLRKIDLCDEVLVVNAVGGKCPACDRFYTCAWCPDCDHAVIVAPYIGASTRNEIAYALAHGKPVRYLHGEGGHLLEVVV